MNTAPRTNLQMVINAFFVLSYIVAFGFFAFTMTQGVLYQNMDYLPVLAVMMVVTDLLGRINKKLGNGA